MLEPLTTTAPLIGNTVAVVLGTMVLFAMLVLPILRLPALVMAAVRWLAESSRRRAALGADLARPLVLGGLSPPLSRLVRQTRTLALELRRCNAEAATWPADATAQTPRSGWRESLFGGSGGQTPLMQLRSDVFEWLRLAETLPASDREALTGLGVDLEAVRKVLTEDLPPAGQVAPAIELRAGAGTGPASSADEDDEQVRRMRWSGALAEHRRGLSRMAASYTRGAADREDLEQDIALALWRALPTFRGESSLKTFAYRVARYCCFRHIRRRKDVGAIEDPVAVADPNACIESAILRADQRALIEQALTELPGNLESVLTLHLSGQSYAQIAETLGISERNVSVRLSRARTRLRRQLVAA